MSTIQQDLRLDDDKSKNLGGSQEQIETLGQDGQTGPRAVVLVSAFAAYNKGQVMRKFWRLYAFGLAASLGGMYSGKLRSGITRMSQLDADYSGYCLSAVGNIVANPGECMTGAATYVNLPSWTEIRVHPAIRNGHQRQRIP